MLAILKWNEEGCRKWIFYGQTAYEVTGQPGHEIFVFLSNLTDVTMADEDTNSILTDYAKRAIQTGGQICN